MYVHKFGVAKDYQGCNLLNDKNMLKSRPWSVVTIKEITMIMLLVLY